MRKGFTLTELLTVIVILGLIILVAYPSVLKVLNDSKERAYESQIKLVEKAAKEWGVENVTSLPDKCDGTLNIELSDLINDGYINGTVINGKEVIENPKKKGKGLTGNVQITYECIPSKKYTYKYIGDND